MLYTTILKGMPYILSDIVVIIPLLTTAAV